jgi:hypothetical protein
MLVQKGTRTWAGELFIFKHSFCGIELVRKLHLLTRLDQPDPAMSKGVGSDTAS